jgi:pilus assembly protein FimV
VPAIQQGVKQDFTEAMSQPNSDMEMDEASDIYKAKEKDTTLSAEEQSLQDEIAENEAKIAEFTAEYVTPFLTADFSGIMSKESDAELEPETREIDGLGDDLDIDALIADSFSKDEASENIQQDQIEYNQADELGYDLDADELSPDSLSQNEASENIQQDEIEDNEADELGDDLDAEQLSTDSLEGSVEQSEDTLLDAIVLSPDFNDEDILAELLAETAESEDKKLNNIDELEVIEELDDVDFDQLLANIGEELASTTDDEVGLTLDEIGDDLVGNNLIDENIQSIEKLEPTEDYVSVDDLLSESLEEVDEVEPYGKTNIDVGLGQFSQNESGVDVDENGSMSSQLDLAKMYIEMNDEENAQVILQEIISKGDVIQKVEAQELLDSL